MRNHPLLGSVGSRTEALQTLQSLDTNVFLADVLDEPSETRINSEILKVTDYPAPFAGHVRVITLNSPRNKNAISRRLLDKLSEEIQKIEEATGKEVQAWRAGGKDAKLGHGTRVLIIGSEVDGVFCAGADLKERLNMTTVE